MPTVATPNLELSSELFRRRYSVAPEGALEHGDNHDPEPSHGLKHSSTRVWTSFQDHANHLTAGSPSKPSFSPGPGDRREGFTWSAPDESGFRPGQHPARPTAQEPKGSSQGSSVDGRQNSWESVKKGRLGLPLKGTADVEKTSSSTLKLLPTISASSSEQPSTMLSTRRTSTTSSLTGKPRRAIPDIRMFDPEHIQGTLRRDQSPPPRPITKAGYNLTFRLPPAMKKSTTLDKAKKHTQFSELPSQRLRHAQFSDPPTQKPAQFPEPPLPKLAQPEASPTHSRIQCPITKLLQSQDSVPTPTLAMPVKRPSVSSSQTNPGGTLKDRRKLDQSLKLTLPIDVPALPPLKRSPVQELSELSDIAPPRPHSPKTPWIREHSPWSLAPPMIPSPATRNAGRDIDRRDHARSTPSDTDFQWVVSGPQKARDRCKITRPRGNRTRSGTSSSSMKTPEQTTPTTPFAPHNQPILPSEELSQLGKQRSKRFRRNNVPWYSEADATDSPSQGITDPSDNRYLLSRVLKKVPGQLLTPPVPTSPSVDAPMHFPLTPIGAIKQRRKKKQNAYRASIANMALPPTFVPPGLNRVNTPPSLIDKETGDVKHKLADFFFDVQSGEPSRRNKNPNRGTPGGVWDSDALLMSMENDILDETDDEEESPQGAASSFAPTPSPINEQPGKQPTSYMALSPHLGTASPHLTSPTALYFLPQYTAQSPLPNTTRENQSTYFRTKMNASDDTNNETPDGEMEMDEEERAKFEWLTPEHLPSSPLCPLHPKYKGEYTGMCVFHGMKKKIGMRGSLGSSGGGTGGTGSTSPGTPGERVMDVRQDAQTRRLVNLSSP